MSSYRLSRKLTFGFLGILCGPACYAQENVVSPVPSGAPATPSVQSPTLDQIRALQAQMQVLERQMEEDRQQLNALRDQLQGLQSAALKQENEAGKQTAATSSTIPLSEAQAAASTQIATLDQKKVETESKFPLRLHGTLLLSAFSNSGGVDDPIAPTAALGGRGSTGLSVRQTSFGLSASGPHIGKAKSFADLDVDFFGVATAGYANTGGLLRLRTAHAAIAWDGAQAYFAQDHTLLAPYRPESLLAVATPELAWSGNLWAWNPQVGFSYHHGADHSVGVEVALVDAGDPYRPPSATSGNSVTVPATLSEASRFPGVQSRLSFQRGTGNRFAGIGVGGYYSPHRLQLGNGAPHFDFAAWATSIDVRVPTIAGIQLTGTFYRGAALGGLGGGGYRDYVYRQNTGQVQVIALDDVGGWAGLQQRIGQRFTWNSGLGFDNPFAGQLRAYPGALTGSPYASVARNRTVFANVIYAPSAYLVFSAEYRNLHTAPITGPLWTSHVAGLGAAYRF